MPDDVPIRHSGALALLSQPVDPPADTTWSKIARVKRAQRARQLLQWSTQPLPEGVTDEFSLDVSDLPLLSLTPRERDIVSQDATGLAQSIRAGDYSAVEVIKAFIAVAAMSQQLTNCLTEVFFEEGIKRAEELDKHLFETGKVVGPLHGVPVTIKDHIQVKGHDTSTGYIAWANKTVAQEDAVAVKILRDAGAILFVKTANPQTLLSLETNNNIFGRTLNPYNRELSSGGSSGGEGALISMHGSPMGIGTDIGGSIRIPAAHCGLYGLKGSVGRIPHAGLLGSHDGMDAIIGALGPLATSARDLSLFCRVMLQYEPWLIEPPLLQIPWKQDLAEGNGIPEKLSIAILWDDGVVKPHPPILSALKHTRDALINAGHDVIDWVPVDHWEAWDLILKLYFLDGGEEYRDILQDDPPVPQTQWILNQVPNNGKPFSVAEIFKLNLAREAFRLKVAKHWNATADRTSTGRQVDAILSAVAPTLAPPHDTTRWWGYTSYWNLVDYPAVVFPVGRFSASDFSIADCAGYPDHLPRNQEESFIQMQWQPEVYNNAPISLQLIGRRLNEEKLLGVLHRVEGARRSK